MCRATRASGSSWTAPPSGRPTGSRGDRCPQAASRSSTSVRVKPASQSASAAGDDHLAELLVHVAILPGRSTALCGVDPGGGRARRLTALERADSLLRGMRLPRRGQTILGDRSPSSTIRRYYVIILGVILLILGLLLKISILTTIGIIVLVVGLVLLLLGSTGRCGRRTQALLLIGLGAASRGSEERPPGPAVSTTAGPGAVPARVRGPGGEDDDVVHVAAGRTVERATAGDQPQFRTVGVAVDVERGEVVLGDDAHLVHREGDDGAVLAGDVDPVADRRGRPARRRPRGRSRRCRRAPRSRPDRRRRGGVSRRTRRPCRSPVPAGAPRACRRG